QGAPRAKAVGKPAPDQLKRGIGVVEGREGEAECQIAEAEVLLHHRCRGGQVYAVDKQDVVHRHQEDQEISGGATVEAEQQHVALSSLGRNSPPGVTPVRDPECAGSSHYFSCHCEERSDEAISIRLPAVDRDCFASLAMTASPRNCLFRERFATQASR